MPVNVFTEDLHASSEAQYKVQCGLLLESLSLRPASALTCESEALLSRRNAWGGLAKSGRNVIQKRWQQHSQRQQSTASDNRGTADTAGLLLSQGAVILNVPSQV